MELLAAIAFFFAISTGIGGAVGPGLFGKLIESGDRDQLFIGCLVAAALMAIAAIVELWLRRGRRAGEARGARHRGLVRRSGRRTYEAA